MICQSGMITASNGTIKPSRMISSSRLSPGKRNMPKPKPDMVERIVEMITTGTTMIKLLPK